MVDGFRHSDFDPAPGDPEMGARAAQLRKYQLEFWDSVLKSDGAAQASLASQAGASKQTDPVWLRAAGLGFAGLRPARGPAPGRRDISSARAETSGR